MRYVLPFLILSPLLVRVSSGMCGDAYCQYNMDIPCPHVGFCHGSHVPCNCTEAGADPNACAECSVPSSVRVVKVVRAADLQASFEVTPPPGEVGWLGADADATLRVAGPSGPLSRVLWIFSDTLMATLDRETMGRALPFTMPHNTVGLVECATTPCAAGARPSFFWRTASTTNKPAAAGGSGGVNIVSFFERDGAPTSSYLWPIMGVSDGPGGGEHALILACESGLVPLACSSIVAIVVTDAGKLSPLDWSYTTHVLPWTPSDNASAGWSCCSAISIDPQNASMVYLVGVARGTSAIGRAALSDLLIHHWGSVEYWGGSQHGWSADSAVLEKSNLGLTTETTVNYNAALSVWYSFRVVGGPWDPTGRPSGLVVYFADTITANVWEKQDGFFPIPTPWSNGSYVCYAAKSHESYADNAATHFGSGTAPALRSTVVMSWVCNEADGQFSLLFGPQTFAPSTRAYWPELMRITLERTLY